MISQLNGSAVRSAYANNLSESKEAQKAPKNVSKQGDMSQVEQIKQALDNGEYKINLQALSQKIAEELL